MTDKPLEALFKLLTYRKSADIKEEDLDPGENPLDYETGHDIRSAAALELGGRRNPIAIEVLVKALNDSGDAAGCNYTRTEFFNAGADTVQKAAVKALAMIGGEDAINALVEKLYQHRHVRYQGVGEEPILEVFGDINHPKSIATLKKFFELGYPSDTYFSTEESGKQEPALIAINSLKKLGVYMKRVILEEDSAYFKGLISDKDQIFGIGWKGIVVNIWDKPITDIRISTIITSFGKDYPFSEHIPCLQPGKKAEFDFYHTKDKWVESKNMVREVLKIEYKR